MCAGYCRTDTVLGLCELSLSLERERERERQRQRQREREHPGVPSPGLFCSTHSTPTGDSCTDTCALVRHTVYTYMDKMSKCHVHVAELTHNTTTYLSPVVVHHVHHTASCHIQSCMDLHVHTCSTTGYGQVLVWIRPVCMCH